MRSELQSYAIAEENLRKAFQLESQKVVKQIEKLSGENMNLMSLKEELAQNQRVLERITELQIALQTEHAVPPRVIWHQPAVKSPKASIEALPCRNMAAAGLFGLGLPFLVIWPLRARVRNSQRLEAGGAARLEDSSSRSKARRPAASH